MLLIAAGLDTILAVTVMLRLAFRLEQYRPPKVRDMPLGDEAPSVSICIPARNERHAMAGCLERVLASDYEKLEIIVFDDNSDDETSVLIRSFAHAGVRFVPGTKLPEGWLGRIHALDVLTQEASGSYLLFMDVDTYITPSTVRQSVALLRQADKTMLSVLPSRYDVWRASTLFGPLRYFWQLLLSSYRRPTASGAFLMVKRDELVRLGGFARFKNEVLAETRLAAAFGRAYMYVMDGGRLGVGDEKKWRSQIETSRRILYPLMRGTRIFGAVIALFLFVFPFIGITIALVTGWWLLFLMFVVLLGAFSLLYGMYTHAVWHGKWWLGVLVWPIVIVQECIVFISSVVGYWRHTITWKGRPITASPVQVESIEINQ